MQKVASVENCLIFYLACMKFVTRFASKLSNGAGFVGMKKLRQL